MKQRRLYSLLLLCVVWLGMYIERYRNMFAGTYHLDLTDPTHVVVVPSNVSSTREAPEVSSLDLFPPFSQASEWLLDLNTDKQVPCGAKKCIYESLLYNNNSGRRRGYMVTQSGRPKIALKSLQRGYRKSKQLSYDFGHENVLLGPPQAFYNITEGFVARLNQMTYASVQDRKIYKVKNEAGVSLPIFVQPTLIVPNSSLFFGCEPNRIEKAYDQLADWIRAKRREKRNKRKMTTTTTTDADTTLSYRYDVSRLSSHLLKEMKSTLLMLNSRQGECMLTDFQLFVDPEPTIDMSESDPRTSIFHIDVDRCFERRPPTNPTLAECTTALQKFIHDVVMAQKEHLS